MRAIFFFLLLFPTLHLAAQNRVQVSGLVKYADLPVEDVHIQNISSKKFTISNASGEFLLILKPGDTLLLTHVGMQDLIRMVKEEDLNNARVFIEMANDPQKLEEVVVNNHPEINVVDLGIIPKKIKKLSVNERRLKTAGDFKPIHLLSLLGGSLQIDPILNAINGRTKRLKRNIKIEKKQKAIAYLEMNFWSYLTTEMQLTDSQAQLLISYVIEEEAFHNLIDLGNEARIQFFLQDAWVRLQNEVSVKS